MKHSLLEKNLISKLETAIVDTAPGVCVRAYQAGKIVCDVSVGKTYPYYDLASLTKIIFTVQAMMLTFEQGKWGIETKVADVLDWYPHKETHIYELLNHSSGLVWWHPFYKEINLDLSLADRRDQFKNLIKNIQLQPSEASVYSDVGFILLSYILEKIFNKEIYEIWKEVKEKFYGGTTLEFHVNNSPIYSRSMYAPTEECPWRKKLMQGEVHDENAWAMGGVSTHSGLFGSIDDVSWYALNMRAQLMGIARYYIRQKTMLLFSRRTRPHGKGDWALGYMLPTPGSASCGHYFSTEAIGHTGFTGTSVWYDAKMDMLIVVLSNRVLYGRDNQNFKKLRPEIHNWIVEGFRRTGV